MKKNEKNKSLIASQRRSDIQKFNKADGKRKAAGKRSLGFDLNYLFSAILAGAVALASLGLVLYFGYHFVRSLTTDVTTATAYDITESEYRRATGYIFRSDADVLTHPSGTPDYKKPDGARVGIEEELCDIYSSVSDDVRSRISEIDREIALIESSLGTGVVQTGLPEALAESKNNYAEILRLIAQGDYSSAATLSDSFLSSLQRIDVLENGGNEAEARLAILRGERSSLISTYGNKTATVKSQSVGYFFRDCDGYENIFTPDLLGEMTVGSFAELVMTEPADVSDAVGKMISDPKWYLCIPLESDAADGFTEGKKYNIVFNDNGAICLEMTLERLVLDLEDHDGDGDRAEALLIFMSKEMPINFSYLRVQDVSVELAEYSGYRIPVSALRYHEGMTGVYTLAGGYVMFRQIDVIYEGNGYVVAADYSVAEPGKPLTYTCLGFNENGKLGDYESLHSFAEERGWEKKIYDNGGIPVPKGDTLRYFYHLDDLEQIILTGKDLYHGKALD